MSHLYRCFVYVVQNRAICALPFDWDRTFCAVLATVFVASVRQALSWQLN